jgi:hypothetical protein
MSTIPEGQPLSQYRPQPNLISGALPACLERLLMPGLHVTVPCMHGMMADQAHLWPAPGEGIGMIAGQTEQGAICQRAAGPAQRGPLQDISGRNLRDMATYCHVQHSQVAILLAVP